RQGAAEADLQAPVLDGLVGPRYLRPGFQVLKRAVDIIAASLLLVALGPLMLLIALSVRLSDGGPAVFSQYRVGRKGRVFRIFKFRTMHTNAEEILRANPVLMEEYLRNYKLDPDPRLTKLGALLRKTTLGELPQLWNVLRGEMSLVGPRPIVEREMEKYGLYQSVYLEMKPGCAGLWQCNGRSDLTYRERVELDVEYFMTAGSRRDMEIVGRTLVAVLARRGAH
ncbi:MAG: sugar transferase, partial [Fimbriimonadaceae bacterium]|nr:sugar transferase [Fimbriimonadaceae bacterium]